VASCRRRSAAELLGRVPPIQNEALSTILDDLIAALSDDSAEATAPSG